MRDRLDAKKALLAADERGYKGAKAFIFGQPKGV
jgi:hypothetical protein